MKEEYIDVTLKFTSDENSPLVVVADLLSEGDTKKKEEFLCSVLDGLLEGANRGAQWVRLERVERRPADGVSPETTPTASPTSSTTDDAGTVPVSSAIINPNEPRMVSYEEAMEFAESVALASGWTEEAQ